MASFPTGVFSPTTKSAGQTIQAAHVNDLQDEVVAIEDGYLNGTARLNAGASTVASLVVSGGSTFTGALTLNGGVASTTSFASSVTFAAGVTFSGTVLGISTPVTLLKSNSGTDASVGATNVDTYALASGLTAKDTLIVLTDVESDAQATADVQLYNATDSVKIATVSGAGGIASGGIRPGITRIRQSQRGNTAVNALALAFGAGTSVAGESIQSTFTTAWTGAWTLALRHSGVTAGGTFRWSWSIYKVAGQ